MRHFWRFFRSVKPISDYLFKVETTVGPIICEDKAQGKLVKQKAIVVALYLFLVISSASFTVKQFIEILSKSCS